MRGKLATAIVFVIIAIIIVDASGGSRKRCRSGGRGRGGGKRRDCATTTTPVATSTSTTTTSTSSSTPSSDPWTNIRLPNTLTPLHYVVDLQPNLAPVSPNYYMFNGSSSVSFTVNTATKYIIIHSNKLNYSEVSVTDANDSPMYSTYMLYEPNQYMVITLNQDMVVGQTYMLRTRFTGELSNDLGGLYRSTYTNSAGETVVIAASQMQPTETRKAFPCFDEPALKATFDVFLWHKDPNFALSNMPNVSTVNMYGDWKRTEFQRTVKMSTYLLAFIICDFDYVESFTQDSVQTRIYGRRGPVSNGDANYAKSLTPVILDFFETFFNISYPLPKSDQVAIPEFASGGMENWGLVFYVETALLYDPVVNSAANQEHVASVISHELAHQWFGNLITTSWWDDLWLNEGFARFIEFYGIDHAEPTWGIMDQFVVIDMLYSMGVDGLASSRPIVAENVQTPAEINALFDVITYNKGACLIRMIHQFTRDVAFKLGLKNLMEKFAYGSVDHAQLFEHWEAAINATAGVDNPPGGFVDSMNTWILQMGYPVVNMARDGTTNTVRMTQNRFLLDPEADLTMPPSPYSYKWNIPFWYATQGNQNKRIMWIERTSAEDTISVPANEYYIGNYEAFGFYRVNYDGDNWNRIIAQLNTDFSVIDVKSRGQMIVDAFNLARAGQVSYDVALGITEFLHNDFEYVPWKSVLGVLGYFSEMLGRSKAYGVYSQYIVNLVQPLYQHVTWIDSGDHLEQYQRVNAINVACKYGNADCISNAVILFADWMRTKTNSITPNLRESVYCNAIANGGVEEWDFAWDQYQNEVNSQERAKIQNGLTCTREPWIIGRLLGMVMNDTLVQFKDAVSIMGKLCYNEFARDATWAHIRESWDFIYDTYGTGAISFTELMNVCTSRFSTNFELNGLEDFIANYSDKLGYVIGTAMQAVEITKTNIKWKQDYEDVVFNWLTNALSA